MCDCAKITKYLINY